MAEGAPRPGSPRTGSAGPGRPLGLLLDGHDRIVRTREPQHGHGPIQQVRAVLALQGGAHMGQVALGAVGRCQLTATGHEVGPLAVVRMERGHRRRSGVHVGRGVERLDRLLPFELLRVGVGAGARPHEAQAPHPLARFFEHAQGHIAAEGIPGQIEALRYLGQHRIGQGLDVLQRWQVRAMAAQVGRQCGAHVAKDVAGVVQTGDEDDVHGFFPQGSMRLSRCSPWMRSPSTQQACTPTEIRSGRITVARGPRAMSVASNTRASERSCTMSVT